MENQLFDFCVGVWVGGHLPATLSHASKDAQYNFTSFDTNLMGAVRKTVQKMNFTGVKIAWVDVKSNKYP